MTESLYPQAGFYWILNCSEKLIAVVTKISALPPRFYTVITVLMKSKPTTEVGSQAH